jgi:hypothetical protein
MFIVIDGSFAGILADDKVLVFVHDVCFRISTPEAQKSSWRVSWRDLASIGAQRT